MNCDAQKMISGTFKLPMLLLDGYSDTTLNLAGGFAGRCFVLFLFCYVNGFAMDGPFGSFSL